MTPACRDWLTLAVGVVVLAAIGLTLGWFLYGEPAGTQPHAPAATQQSLP